MKIKPYFNVAGPCVPGKHYMLPAQERCQGIQELIDQEQYFVIHAARQSGKTTLLKELTKEINGEDNYYALYCSLESIEKIPEPERGIPAIMRVLAAQIRFSKRLRGIPFAEQSRDEDFNTVMRESLSYFCEDLDKPFIIFFDEIDCLSNGTLITFLRQLRDGYVNRPEIPFVHSVALVGMRNIRDYKGKIRDDQDTLGTASPFNIVTETFTLRNFTRDEMTRLYAQHTRATGQVFLPDVVDAIYDAAQGQPWLVNAIAKEIVVKMLANDTSQPILTQYVEQAIETLIQQRGTHFDSLMKRLQEIRVRRIVEPVILG
ncbi:MAG: ATP-binding protein, partial [bacterium]|nr:ATP-binding protein [bacterium]